VTTWVAFLRGVNLGKRQMKMAELRASCEGAGFTAVKTVLASGNVRFDAKPGDEAKVRGRLEAALQKDFAFPVKAVMRSAADIEAMIASEPFTSVKGEDHVMSYVMLAAEPIRPVPDVSVLPAHIEAPRIDAREIYLVARKLPNGRYSEGLETLDKELPKDLLVTTRNWNTMLKVLA
jgi:uncharacterized protein (DUF1697 family)